MLTVTWWCLIGIEIGSCCLLIINLFIYFTFDIAHCPPHSPDAHGTPIGNKNDSLRTSKTTRQKTARAKMPLSLSLTSTLCCLGTAGKWNTWAVAAIVCVPFPFVFNCDALSLASWSGWLANRIAVSAALRWHSIKFVIVIYAIRKSCVYTMRSPLIRSLHTDTDTHTLTQAGTSTCCSHSLAYVCPYKLCPPVCVSDTTLWSIF